MQDVLEEVTRVNFFAICFPGACEDRPVLATLFSVSLILQLVYILMHFRMIYFKR